MCFLLLSLLLLLVCVFVCVFVCLFVYLFVCLFVCLCVFVCVVDWVTCRDTLLKAKDHEFLHPVSRLCADCEQRFGDMTWRCLIWLKNNKHATIYAWVCVCGGLCVYV